MKKFLLIVICVFLVGLTLSFFVEDKNFFVANIKSPEREDISLIFVGDIMLSRHIGKVMKEKDDWIFPFREIAEELQSADILFGNLEGMISDKGEDGGGIYSFRADPRAIEGLTFAGFDVLSVANNHSFDWGGEAILDSIERLNQAGIHTVGGGKNIEEAWAPVILEKNGTVFAFFAFSEFFGGLKVGRAEIAEIDIERIKRAISNAKNERGADIVILSVHWGEEYKTVSNDFQRDIARRAILAGANIVVGHHPHVIQEIEEYEGGLIVYSLGNFIFDQNFSEDTRKGLMLKVLFNGGEIIEVLPIEIRFNSFFQPYI